MMGHPPAPPRVTPPSLREGKRTLWPGEAGSTGALDGTPRLLQLTALQEGI